MTRPLALIGMVALLLLFGLVKPTFGIVSLAAFCVGYATARMARDHN